MVEWVSGVLTPLVKTIFVLFIVGFILFVVIRAVLKLWQKRLKWFIKYKIFRQQYEPELVDWCMQLIDEEKSSIDVKKMLLINGSTNEYINEVMWVYNEIGKQLWTDMQREQKQQAKLNKKVKGGKNNNGREFTTSNGQNKETEGAEGNTTATTSTATKTNPTTSTISSRLPKL